MPLVCQIKPGDWHSVELAIRQVIRQLGPQAAVSFAEVELNGVAPNRVLATNVNSKITAAALVDFILAGDNILVTDNGNGTITLSSTAEGAGIVEVADAAERLASDARVVYQQDIKKLYLRRT